MDRSMIVALSVATALHAGVLLGFKRGAAPVVAKLTPMVPLTVFKNLPVEEPPPEEIVSDEKLPPPDLSPVRRSEEIPVVNPNPNDFQQRIVPAVDVDRPIATLQNVNFNATEGISARVPIGIGELENTPHARVQIAPPYPFDAKTRGLTGRVLVEFVVDESGHVINPRIVESTDSVFNETTLRTIVKWRFEPGRKYGRNVRFRMALPLEFNLNDN